MATKGSTIKIADNLRPTISGGESRPTNPDMSGLAGGIFNTRSRSRAGSPTSARAELSQGEELGDEWRDGSQKKKQVFKGKTLFLYAFPLSGNYLWDEC